MYANGYFEQQRRSPVSLAAVIGLHGAAIAVLALYGTTQFVANKSPNTKVFNVPIEQPPDPLPPPPTTPQTERQVQTPPDRVTATETQTVTSSQLTTQVTPPQPPVPPVPPGPQLALNTTPAIPPPIRRAAQVDPNYRDALQPPYPRIEETNQREGSVRVRITIGANGRVTAIDRLSATSDAFWQVTQRQALNRWRFRPATLDGRPVDSTMVFTVTFRLPEA